MDKACVTSVLLYSVIVTSLAMASAAGSAAQTARGFDIQVVDLSTTPAPDDLAKARQMYRAGNIVRIIGGKPRHFRSLLSVGAGDSQFNETLSRHRNHTSEAPFRVRQTPLVLGAMAVRADEGGALHQFFGFTSKKGDETVWQAGFDRWVQHERDLSVGIAVGDTPPAEAWTKLQEQTLSGSDSNSNVYQHTIQVYRLNTDASGSNGPPDEYMVITQPQSQPNFYETNCAVSSCGWWTNQRTFTITTSPQFVLFDHQPIDQITTSDVKFTIGAGAGPTGPNVEAGVTFDWSQPSVTTTDQSSLTGGSAGWGESFQGEGAFSAPPLTSTGPFYSFNGAIFQVPAGTTSFTLSISGVYDFHRDDGFYIFDSETFGLSNMYISPPSFSLDPPALRIAPGNAGTLNINALIPNSTQGIPWILTNIPQWLSASQTSGAGPALINLSVEPGTPVGSTASLNLNTNPAFAAPSVETNPLSVGVTVGQPTTALGAVLIAGGTSTSNNGNSNIIFSGSELFSSVNNAISGQTAMLLARTNHTATTLKTGQVLITGGFGGGSGDYSNATTLASAELYSPASNSFAGVNGNIVCPGGAGCMAVARQFHAATLLLDGRVLITGGTTDGTTPLNSAEIFDPATATFTPVANMATARFSHTTTLLKNGTVLIAGGLSANQAPTAAAEIFNPTSGVFTPAAGNLSVARYLHTATLLNDGNVLLAGGIQSDQSATAVSEIFNTATGSFADGPNLNNSRATHTATLLDNGQILIAAGYNVPVPLATETLATAEIYDPEGNTFTLLSANSACPGSAGCMLSALDNRAAALLPGGQVFISGGGDSDGNSSGNTEIYNPETKSFSAGPVIVPVLFHTTVLLDKTATTVSLQATPNPSVRGRAVQLTATVSSSAAAMPTGTVTFLEGTATLGTATLDNGAASFSITSLASGPHTITARYEGDQYYAPGTSSPVVQNVNAAVTSTTLNSSPNPSAYGQTVTFGITVTASAGTPTGVVTLYEGGQSIGTAQLTGGVASFATAALSGGLHSMIASYSGDSNFSGSTSAPLVQTVGAQPTQTSLVSSPNPSSLGGSVSLTASTTAAGGSPTGTVTFRDGNSTVGTAPLVSGKATFATALLSGGTHNLTAAYGGNGSFATSTSPLLTQTVNAATTQTTLSSGLNPSYFGQMVTFSIAVSSTAGTPAGTVTIRDGGLTIGTAQLSSGGGSFATANLAGGSHQITASYNGNANYAASNSPAVNQLVNPAAAQVALSSNLNPSSFGQQVTLRAVVTSSAGAPGGTVNFFDGAASLGTVNLVQGTASITTSRLAAGQHSITANYGGSASFSPAASAPVEQSVTARLTTTTVLTSNLNPSSELDNVIFTARVVAQDGSTAQGSVTFDDGSGLLGTVPLTGGSASFAVSILSTGQHKITARFTGNSPYLKSSGSLVQSVDPLK